MFPDVMAFTGTTPKATSVEPLVAVDDVAWPSEISDSER
jgi:hypothetical protein